MERTKTDFFAILVSLVAFLVAVYGVEFQPVTVDSTRPTHLREQPNKGDSAVADARLWDDPSFVFPEETTRSIRPEVVKAGEQALILILPTIKIGRTPFDVFTRTHRRGISYAKADAS